MAALAWVVLGVIVGVVLHRPHPASRATSALLGVAGALLGGVVAAVLNIGDVDRFFSASTWVVAVAGALVAVTIHGALADSRSRGQRAVR